jgi:acetyltransferase-like isoleucine patch superfamily enzyme
MTEFYRSFAKANSGPVRFARAVYRALMQLSIPAPRFIFWPLYMLVLLVRQSWYFITRVFFCEPLFKAACRSYGRNVHTGSFLHWISGPGDLILGDNVSIDGRCNFFFAVRYTERPALIIGNNTGIGHNCSFIVGKQIKVGNYCRLASSITLMDSPGHPLDPERRKAGHPADPADVRPITIGDNVWIGTNSTVMPGVTIGDNSVVAFGSVVMNDVPPNTVVAGNPARKIAAIPLAQSHPAYNAPQ